MSNYGNEFKNKHILIVGASGGIGSGISKKLANEGARLTLMARNREKLERLNNGLNGSDHNIYISDMNDVDLISRQIDDVVAMSGPFDGLVYCAGITKDRPLRQFKPAVVLEVMRVNLLSFIEVVRCCTSAGHFNEGMKIVGLMLILFSLE